MQVIISNKLTHKGSSWGHGTIDMYTEMKTSQQELVLKPRTDPISFTIEKKGHFFKCTLFVNYIDIFGLCFIDYSKAFDKVRHSDLFDILKRHSCNGKDLRVIRNLYWEQEAAIRVDSDSACSEYRPIYRRVRQGFGFFFPPDLFNIYSEMILRNIKQHEGVKVGGHNINNLRYADGTALIADSRERLQNIITTVTIESEHKGLQLNAKKTESMVILKQPDVPVCNILCKGERIKQVRPLNTWTSQ
ncbi:retrovirus-related pol polyprotein line-1 [Plakobranchus ocellatus]|uniref:Retrovirus-related pol polyprotein line-1 n=1 Tax=Plakobranchus ocellatus TaxID=259542 RepID=A0AAV3YIB6_9GAST|nr:retrovirus-related pol polyprotein line-1 [Plakobranchus ocellatus]